MAEDTRPTLFYSWQSDHSKTRGYIEDALKKALENVANTLDIENAPRLDKDTQGEVGAVSITSVIKKKISDSKIFVADVSLIDLGKKGKKLANQNVMFELGYAFGKKTENAVMLIANKDLGDASELPFDIAQNRIIFCSPKNDPKAHKLVPVLEYAIRAHLGFIEEADRTDERADAKEMLLYAIVNNKPTATKSEKLFDELYKRYLEVAPDRYRGGDVETYGEQVADAYQKSLTITSELYEVIQTAAEYGDATVVTTAYRMLGVLSAMYDNQPGENSKYEISDDYYSLVIQEVASIIIGLLARYGRWKIIGELIPREFLKPKNGNKKYSIGTTYHYPQSVKTYFNKKTGQNYAIPTTPLIQERFVDSDKMLHAYADGALVLMFALDFYYPFVAGLFLSSDQSYIPEFITELKKRGFADSFRLALPVSNLDELRTRLDEKRQQKLTDGLAYWNNDLTHIFNAEGLMPISEVGSK
jgi:hypothetical protein